MTHPIRDRLSADLQRLTEAGSLRAQRIRDIVKAAIAEAVVEVKAGSGDVRSIVQEAVATVLEPEAPASAEEPSVIEVQAVVEGLVEGVDDATRITIEQAQGQIDELQAVIDEQDQVLDSAIEGAIAALDRTEQASGQTDNTRTVRSRLEDLVADLRNKQWGRVQQQYQTLKVQLDRLDQRLAERYGDRYQALKDQVEEAKVWYEDTKARVAEGEESPGDQAQRQIETQGQSLGTTVAQIEIAVKRRLQALWEARFGSGETPESEVHPPKHSN
jgi:predicted  nucleic acid-binding Zn-ribbon protein